MVVDSNLKLISYNKDSNRIFTLSGSDLNRSILEATCQCEISDFEEKLVDTIKSGNGSDGIVEVNRHVYQMRIYPNKDDSGRISGAVIVFYDNTQIIRAQEKLQASDLSIRAIIDGSPTLISLKDSMGKYLVVNRAFRERYQVTDSEIIGKTDRQLFDEALTLQIRDNDLEVLLKRTNAEHQETIPFQGKEYIYYSSRFPVQTAAGNSLQVVGTVSLDVTEQIKSQSALMASESRYRAIVEDQAVLVCRYLPKGRITFVNSAFCSFLGGTAETNLKHSFLDFVDSSDRVKANLEVDRLSPEHSITQYETKILSHSHLNQSEQQKWVRWIHRAIFAADGTPLEYQVVGFDVTALHLQTDYLLQKENLFTHVLEHTSDFLTVYKVENEDFVLESFNQSAAKSRNYGHAKLIGKKLTDLSDSINADFILEKYKESYASGQVTTFEEEIDTPNGSKHLLTTLLPIRNDDQAVDRIAALSRDITPLKRVEQALREQKNVSDTSNQAKSDFLAAMSHELRTPLSVITGMSQLLNRGELTTQQKRYVVSIQQSSKVLLALIEDVLDLSKIEAGKLNLEFRPFSFPEVISEVSTSFETQATQKGLQFHHSLSGSAAPILLGDQIRIKQILLNLVGNALKFTQSGSIEVKLNLLPTRTEAHWRARVEVIDTGVGIPEEAFHRIFGRFSQADSGISRKFGGTGLGLAISKQLVELMDGQIGFESEKGKGSKFWFVIDLPVAPAGSVTEQAQITAPLSLKNVCALAVDDNAENLNMLAEHLRDHLGELYLASSAEEAIELLKQKPIDIVLMDVQMPGMDGVEATRVIRSLPDGKKSVPIIALTANAMSGDRERFLAAGMNDYLSKPLDFEVLFQKLAQVKTFAQKH
jgi:two-component system CheB/CheR fusion protein